jgi:N-carbamoyl-L-amino-acid hydrolase
MQGASMITTNRDRLWRTLMEMAQIGATATGGCDRLALTDADRSARDLFMRWCEEAGCRVRVDQMGNIFARREGLRADAPPIIIGSHLDTQSTGGKFDGVYGVLAALEVIQTLNDARQSTEFPLEAVVWSNEEGARLSPAMLGSGVWAGVHTQTYAHARTDASGRRFDDELQRIGYLGQYPCKAETVRAAFEAHIEQGPVLERSGKQIGIVTGIQGVRWFDITIDGKSCHAGTTPMDARNDPVMALGRMIEDFFLLARHHSPLARLTIGRLNAIPGAYNTVPSRVIAGVDIRHPEKKVLDELTRSLMDIVQSSCEPHGGIGAVHKELDCPPVTFAEECVNAVQRAVNTLGYPAMQLVSGAAHDSMHVARVAPTSMIFVPCEDGISHNASERAKPEDLEAGCNVLLGSVLEVQ